jgi:hypothetical protein
MSKPQRAAKSASETQLRKNITAPLKSKGHGRKIVTAATLARAAQILEGNNSRGKNKKDEPIKVSSTRVERPKPTKSSSKPSPSRTAEPIRERDGRKKTPAALPASSSEKKTPKGRSKGTKTEKTPGMQRVFKATPAVDLNEGPNFGKVINQIEETFQPKTPRKKKDA